MKGDSMGTIVILGILAMVLFGGAKNTNNAGLFSVNNNPKSETAISREQQIRKTQDQLEDLKKQLQIEEDKKTQSQYKDMVTLSYINRSSNPSQEYVTIRVNGKTDEAISVTGWTLKSLSTGNQVLIPKGTYLFFTGMLNTEEDIKLETNDVMYLVTGISPNGASFKINKCSGYLGQFQKFVPYLNTSCPAPRDEDLSSIPKLVINDACFDYIERMNRCRIQTEPLPVNWSTECINFIYDKINYPSCVNAHKNDKDFYQKEWRVYLKRSERVWKDRRETVVLYDNFGKVVDTLEY